MATDLGMGQRLEFVLCSCMLALRLGEALGLNEAQQREVYYQALWQEDLVRSFPGSAG